ncbi:MAG: hypothetical protein ACLQIB_06585, partial [Isosphaeraceae bacterium]
LKRGRILLGGASGRAVQSSWLGGPPFGRCPLAPEFGSSFRWSGAYRDGAVDFSKATSVAGPSITFGTSKNSNIPMVYNIVPNKLELSQVILIFERQTDSDQTDHMDWGFKATNLYGIDYRYTTAKGWFSDQLLKHNHLYGYDPLQLYFDIYFPHVAQGMILRVGR